MLVYLRLSSFLLIVLFPTVVFSETSLKDFRSTDTAHGLYEINEAVIKFLDEEKTKSNINRRSMGPNLKIWVPKCSVPLKVEWTPKYYGLSNRHSVSVYCDKTIDGSHEKKWRVNIPTAEK